MLTEGIDAALDALEACRRHVPALMNLFRPGTPARADIDAVIAAAQRAKVSVYDPSEAAGGRYAPRRRLHPATHQPDRVYFALKLEPQMAEQVASVGNRLSAKLGLLGRVSPLVLHVTLCPVGLLPGLSEERLEAARKAAARVVGRPFELAFDRVRSYPTGADKPPFVAFPAQGSPEGNLLRRSLILELRRTGFAVPKALPDLHMTLFYDHGVVADEPLDPPIRWTARSFVLIRSLFGQTLHEALGEWSLGG